MQDNDNSDATYYRMRLGNASWTVPVSIHSQCALLKFYH